MKKDRDIRESAEFGHELAKYNGCSLSSFIKENSKALDWAQRRSLVGFGELKAIGTFLDEVSGREPILGLSIPLLLFTKSPEHEYHPQYECERQREPGSIRDLCEGGRKKSSIHACDREPREHNNERADAPHKGGRQRHHTGIEKCDKHDASSIGIP